MRQRQITERVQVDIKGMINRNKLYEEKNKGPVYMPRFITLGTLLS